MYEYLNAKAFIIIIMLVQMCLFIFHTANVDYVPLTLAPIVFNPGSSSSVNSTSCCTLVILDDDAVENDETISLSMSASTPVNIQQSTSFAVVTIKEGTADSKSESSVLHSFFIVIVRHLCWSW